MKPKNLTVSNICKNIARENGLKVEVISDQVSTLIISTHNTNEQNKLNAIYDSFQYSKPTNSGDSKINGRPFTKEDRINFINGYIDMNDAINPEYINDDYAKKMMEVLAIAAKDELVKKYGTKGYKNPSLKYMVGLRYGYEAYKKTSK